MSYLPDWHQQSVEQVLAKLDSTRDGLGATEVARRQLLDGPNQLSEGKRLSPLRILAAQFRSLMIWILIAAGLAAGLMGDIGDALAILAIVMLNAMIGFYQEFKAEQSIAALRRMAAPQVKVLRDGRLTSVAAAAIVRGDVLELEAGDLIAADARLIAAASLRCVESALTGESEAVSKDPATLDAGSIALADCKNMLFMGTSVVAGTGTAVVVGTAMNTELGGIAGLIDEADSNRDTPLQHQLDAVGRILIWAALGIVALLFVLGLLRGIDLRELVMTSISLAVAAVPEGLPAVVTVALSVGVLRMARRRALIRKLAAVETLGSTSVICTDKTGTLTMGEMTARVLYVDEQRFEVGGAGYAPEGEICFEGNTVGERHRPALMALASVQLGCNNAQLIQERGTWKTIGDPTEGALLAAAAKAGADRAQIEREWPMQRELPFDSERKRSSVIRRRPDGGLRVFVNGAPGVLLERCTHCYTGAGTLPLTPPMRERILAQASAMAGHALRVLGSAIRDLDVSVDTCGDSDEIERDLIFVGLTGMQDPPRPEARDAIASCRAAGVRVVMITGDHPTTATAIATELGLADSCSAVTGVALDQLSDDELRQQAQQIPVYARVTAAHKLRIIRALKAHGDVVAMTGDGINDAPAIKGADIGIAMGKTGTEVTKQAADMIIVDDNFATIVAAVEEGRGIYDNIRKTLQYLLAGSTAELLLMAVCVIIGLPAPLLPIHLLWINLVTDGLPALCLAADPIDPGVMTRAPRPNAERMTNPRFLRTMLFTGFVTAALAFSVYRYLLETETTETARTYAFTVLVFAEILRAFGARSEIIPVWRIPLRTNINLVVVVLLTLAFQVCSQYNDLLGAFLKTADMPLHHYGLLLILGLIPLATLEVVKLLRQPSR